jgi:hypothetical protein
MDGWIPANADSPSFADRFRVVKPSPPPDASKSYGTKGLNQLEIAQSGASLHQVDRLKLDDVKISPAHDINWGRTILQEFAPLVPARKEHYWDPITLAGGFKKIRSENDTCRYFQSTVLDQAVTAAICLYDQLMRTVVNTDIDTTTSYPEGHWEIRDISTIGSGGRSDLAVFRDEIPASLFEGKTRRVCSCTNLGASVFEMLWEEIHTGQTFPMDCPDKAHTMRPPGDLNWYPDASWQKKMQKFCFQVRLCLFAIYFVQLAHELR